MAGSIPENFWWKNITGPSAMISAASNALSEGYSIILGVPGFTSWPEKMREFLREEISAGGAYITIIDAGLECPEKAGDYLIRRFDTERRYRSRLSSVQEYFMSTGLLGGHVFWLHSFRDKEQASDWVDFCSKYPSDSLSTGLFIIDTESAGLQPSSRVRSVNYSDYVERYDTQIFASFLLDVEGYGRPHYTRDWKEYVSVLSAMLCGSDAETAGALIGSTDFMLDDPYDALRTLAQDLPYRGKETGHILRLVRDYDDAAVKNRIWTAQVQVFFPMIELERVRIIRGTEGLSEKLNTALMYKNANGSPMRQSDGTIVLSSEELDTGGLCYLLCGNMIHPADNELNEYVSLLRKFRNSLAHMKPCNVDDVREFLRYRSYYSDKLRI
ncbi:MAG: hypothetical protein IJG65_05030 [Synergistaceae bacterium]|nr:hypothetical protein [Synergistaceae bacterium]